jgi:hypothetical protein
MRRMTLFQTLLNMAGLVIMWVSSIVLVGMLAASAWSLLVWGWDLVR